VKSRWRPDPKTCSLVLGGAIVLHAGTAAANGRFPQSNQIVFSPTNPDLIVLRTTYGILPSHDDGATWQFLCEDAIGVGPSTLADPPLGLTEDDSLLAGVSLGLNVSPDVGCNWSCIGGPLANQVIVDLAVRPDSPKSAVAITGTFATQPDSGQEVSFSQVFETTDDGASWAAIGVPIDPTVVVSTVDVTRTDPDRLYVSGVHGYGSQRSALLFVSMDRGTTWTERPLPAAQFDPSTEDQIFIGGVDPANADRLYLRSSALPMGGRSRLTVVTLGADGTPTFVGAHQFDAGQVFTGFFTGEMLGFALSADGSRVYIGSSQDGLWSARASDLAFQKVSNIGVQCLATRGSELWACSAEVSGFIAGVSTDEGKTFTARLPRIAGVTGPIACAPDPAGVACGQKANASMCGPYYDSFCATYGCDASAPAPVVDAGAPARGSPADASTRAAAESSSSSCDCDLAAPRREGAAGLGAALALVGFALQRRTRR
jgi:hypothetical protein